MSEGVFPQRRFGVETWRAPSLPSVAPPLGFPRYRAKGAAYAAPENGKRSAPTGRRVVPRGNAKARNGGRRSRSAAKPQSDRWSPKRFAPPIASLRLPFFPDSVGQARASAMARSRAAISSSVSSGKSARRALARRPSFWRARRAKSWARASGISTMARKRV